MVRSLMSPGAGQALRFLLQPDFSRLTRIGILEALGSAFFSLSLGMGAMLTYGSYLDKTTNISSAALEISLLDTFFSVMAGLMIFPIVFTCGLDPGAGPGLLFVTLPEIFARLPGGQVCGFLFFVLVAFAAITSAISLLEVCPFLLMNWAGPAKGLTTRLARSSSYAAFLSALSFNLWSGFTFMGGKNIFDLLDGFASNILLPLGGLGIAIFAGWVLTHGEKEAEIKHIENAFHFYDIWHVLIKYVTPVALFIVLLYTTGIIGLISKYF